MRDQGRLVEWFDEKGYGFIQPDDAEKERSLFAYQRFCHAPDLGQLLVVHWNIW